MKTNKLKLLTITAITGLTALVGLGALVHNHIKEAKADTITDLTDTIWLFDDIIDIDYLNEDWSINFSSNNGTFKTLSPYDDIGQEPPVQYLYYTSTNSNIWADVTAYQDGEWTAEAYKTIYILSGEDVTNSDLIDWLEANATLQSGGGSEPEEPTPEEPTPDTPSDSVNTFYQFTFNAQINYYAPYDTNISNYFTSDSDMTTNGSFKAITIFEGVAFTSGGQTFNKMVSRYRSAMASSYYDDSGNLQAWSVNGYASYTWLEYVNTDTNKVVVVNMRDTKEFTSNGVGNAVLRSSSWIAPQYRYLTFSSSVDELFITNLSKFNNASTEVGNSFVEYTDTGLGGAFGLISQAFGSMLPILSIQILPNISLGLLLFLPLMVGIVILIIWVVKR